VESSAPQPPILKPKREKECTQYTVKTQLKDRTTETFQAETRYRHPRYYYFDTVSEAKEALASNKFEGRLSCDGLSKFSRDEEEQISYEIWEVGSSSRDRKK